MSYLSKRADAIDASGIRKVFDLAAKLKDPINLSIGLPDFDVPEPAKEAAIKAIREGNNRYTQTQGIAPLREKLHKILSAELGRDVGEVLITSGVSGALMLAVQALIDPGDEVIFLDPFFVMYKHIVTMAGGTSVPVDAYPDFRFNAAKVEAAITPRTKLLILNSPSNPTGILMTEEDTKAAAALAKKHNLLIMSDEIYDPFIYPGKVTSVAKYHENTLLLRGFSKSHAMTGWRLGYATGPADLIQAMAKLQQYTFVCAPSPMQIAAAMALDLDMSSHVAAYREKRDMVYSMLSTKFEVTKPEGAFYIFPKAPAKYASASEFVTKAIEKNVLIIPGNVFSMKDTHFRISYATTNEKLEQGCEILCKLA